MGVARRAHPDRRRRTRGTVRSAIDSPLALPPERLQLLVRSDRLLCINRSTGGLEQFSRG
jgi:hypothetical protein